MKTLIVIGVAAFVLFLIGMIRVGAEASFDDRGFRFAVRFWFIRIQLGGKDKPNKKKKEKNTSDGSEEEEPKKKKKPPPVTMLLSAAKRGYALLCRLVSGLRVDVLKLHFTSAFDDPAAAALAYGAAGTAMDALSRIGGDHIVCSDMRADIDFDGSVPRYDFQIGARLRIGRLLGAALRFGFGVLIDLLLEKRKEKKYG